MSSRDNYDVSVVILTRNSARTLERCLRSVIREKPGEVIAVDGLSTDSTPGILKRYDIRTLVDPRRSIGYSRLIGVQAAKGSYVMFVDSDVVLVPSCISTLRRELERHDWVGVHAKLISPEKTSYWQRAEGEKFRREYNNVGPTNRIDTIAALFRREVLLRYPFDPNFEVSAEDVDLCRRLVRNKHRLGVSNAVAYHYYRQGFLAFIKQRFRYGLGRARLGIKYGEARILVEPIFAIFSQISRELWAEGVWLVPYWVVGGLVDFLGVVVGVSRMARARGH